VLHIHYYKETHRRSIESPEYKHLMYVDRQCRCGKLKGKYV